VGPALSSDAGDSQFVEIFGQCQKHKIPMTAEKFPRDALMAVSIRGFCIPEGGNSYSLSSPQVSFFPFNDPLHNETREPRDFFFVSPDTTISGVRPRSESRDAVLLHRSAG
jgi:hypothetical protein